MNIVGIHPLKHWWLRRRVRGGVRDGLARDEVFNKLGKPDREDYPDPGDVVWIYHLGKSGGYSFDYSILIRDESAVTSWWGSHLIRNGDDDA
jgi:hypothetical protein